MTEPVVRTESLGGSPLARAAIDGRLEDWYVAAPKSPQAWKARADAVRGTNGSRPWLDTLRGALSPSGAAAARLERVGSGRGVVVTTGQQPGLFGGPIYTWSKALSALALADEIERVTGVPTAPVFWAATDDADFAEACWTAVAVVGGVERLAVDAGAPLGRPMADMPLGDTTRAFDALRLACGATIDDHPLEAARNAYRPGATVGGAYVEFLRALFEPLGIAVLDASHPAMSEATRPFLVRALDRAQGVVTALDARDQAILGAGYATQVSEVAGLSLVSERPIGGGDKRRVPISEASAVAAGSDAERRVVLSPNVLLRPVIERAILPTVTYMGGPGEIAYFAQVSAVAASLGLDAPMIVPRWSATIVEPHITRILSALGVDEAELAEPHRAEGRLAKQAVPPGIQRALAQLRGELDRGATALSDALEASGLPLTDRVVEGAERTIQHRLERLERRIIAATKRSHAETMTQIATARGALFPLGKRQERALNIIPFLARHGSIVIDRMAAGARAHARLLVGSGAEAASERSHTTPRSSGGETTRSVSHAEPTRTADA
jgi:uncharacterized protein YllA (UPF0747 family)